MRISDVMTANVVTVRAETPLTEVASILAELRISGLPVVDEAGRGPLAGPVVAAAVVATVAVLFAFRFDGLSRAVMVIDAVLLLIGIAGSRISFRLLHTWLARRRPR